MFETTTDEEKPMVTSAPLAGAQRGRLEIRQGVSECHLHALDSEAGSTYRDDAGALLYRARFRGRAPEVTAHGGVVEMQWDWHSWWRRGNHGADIELSAQIAWDIEVRGGSSELRADLAAIRLESVRIRGGMSETRLLLGPPTSVVPIEIGGGVSDLTIVRPAGVPVRLRVRGGASDVRLDQQMFGAVGGKLELTSASFDEGTGYDIEVRGGASSISISEAPRPS